MDLGRLGWNRQLDGSFTYETMDLKSVVDDFHCELEDGTKFQLHDYSPQLHSDHVFINCTLKFSAWVVLPEMISLHESNGFPSWMIDSFIWDLHVSDFEGSPKQFLAALKNGRLQCIFLAKGDYNSYFLVIEEKGGFARRIGTGEALYYGNYHKFADEVVFQSTKREICLK